MLNVVRERIRKEYFTPTWLGIVVNPFYLIRKGLYKNIKSLSSEIHGKVLDFGCGSKPYEALFASSDEYIGLDIETSGHNHVESKVDVFYDGKTIPFGGAYFDSVVSFESFEHIFELPAILDEINRVLKTDGKLLISVPFVWDEHEIPYDYGRYTSFGLTYLLEKHGFEIIEYKKTTTYIETICQMAIAYVAQHLMPKNRWLRHAFQYGIIFPMNIFSFFLNKILPANYNFFCNSVVLARKIRI